MGGFKIFPWIGGTLLEAKRDTAFYHIYIQHHYFDLLAGRYNLARVNIFLCPAHLGDVHQTFNPFIQLNKCAIIGDVGHAARQFRTNGEFLGSICPGVRLQLFHAK